MSVVSVQEQQHLCGTTRTNDGKGDKAKRVFIVRCSGPTSPVVVENADGLPAMYDKLPGDDGRVVTSKSVTCLGKTDQWKVDVEYEAVESENKDPEVAPWDMPDEVTWDFSESSESFFRDTDDKPVVNSAGEPFEDFLEKDAGELSVTVVRNSLRYSPSNALEYRNMVNQGSFSIGGQKISDGQAKMSVGGTARTAYYKGQLYYVVTYKMKLRESWDVKVEDRGFNEKNIAKPGELKAIVKGTPPVQVDKPWPLDGSGAKKPNSTDAPEQLTFKPYKKKSFSTFRFR